MTSTPTRRSASHGGICSCQRGRCRHRQGMMERAQGARRRVERARSLTVRESASCSLPNPPTRWKHRDRCRSQGPGDRVALNGAPGLGPRCDEGLRGTQPREPAPKMPALRVTPQVNHASTGSTVPGTRIGSSRLGPRLAARGDNVEFRTLSGEVRRCCLLALRFVEVLLILTTWTSDHHRWRR